LAAAALGVLAGIGARVFAWMLRRAKQLTTTLPALVRVPLAGAALAAIFVIARVATGENVTTGPGYETVKWALDPAHSAWLILLVLVLRCCATSVTVGGGGVGGLFIPLVVAGALTGRIVGGVVNELDTTLFAVIGVAAFLGAGYRVPLAAITFVAEATGRPGFVVPGLIAAVVAELMMSNSSVTTYQHRAIAELDAPTE
jgi:CIC family chloride channel protein